MSAPGDGAPGEGGAASGARAGSGDHGERIDVRRVLWLITRREIVTRTRSKAFRITTGLFILAIAGFVVAMKITGSDSSAPSVAFTASTQDLADPLRSAVAVVADQDEPAVSVVADQGAGEARVRDGDVDALVVGTPRAFRVLVDEELDPTLTSAFALVAQQRALNAEIDRLGGDPAAVGAAVAAAKVDVVALEPPDERGKVDDQRVVLGVVTGILIYLSLLVFGPQVSQGVIEEKSSRVVELLLATVRPWQLMVGKVIGIGVVAFGQIALLGAVGVVLGLATGVLDIPTSVATGVAAWALVWYLLGFAVYALLFAATGALVSRQEDAGGVTAPVIMLIILPYVLGASVLPGDPNNSLVAGLALVPLFAPLLMPMMIAIGSADAWQIAFAVVATVALIGVLAWLAGRIYGNAVTRTGTRVRLFDALRPADHPRPTSRISSA
jgi:ABC-2 type transport system permease protein